MKNRNPAAVFKAPMPHEDHRFLFFSLLLGRPVYIERVGNRLGKLSDLVFRLTEPYPEAVGLYLEHGWGQPTELVPMEKVLRIDSDAIFVAKPDGETYAPFVDQPGWILVNEHFMGRTILDMYGRQVEVVNDVHLLESKGRMIIVHVDVSFNGFLRKWGLGRLSWIKDNFISWKYVQPLSMEDVGATDTVSLSVTRQELTEVPSEDLADALEELSGEEQEAVFSALDAKKAAETLVEAEPRTQRQLVADLRKEKARAILSQMSVPQVADLFSVLPHDDMEKLMGLVPADYAERVTSIITEHETTAKVLMSQDFITATKNQTVGGLLPTLRQPGLSHDAVTYTYIVEENLHTLIGVVDLREIIRASDGTILDDLMVSPVVFAEEDDIRETIEELFVKYNFRMIPVVDAHQRMIGVVRFKDIMAGYASRANG